MQTDLKTTKPEPYPPVPADLDSLYNIIIKTNRLSALEYGSGWSTETIAEALADLEDIDGITRTFHTVDADHYYLDRALERVKDWYDVKGHVGSAFFTRFNHQDCVAYDFSPPVPPDFIYLDGPEPYQAIGWDDCPPVSCDILRFENILLPLTIIVVDGRALNARFLFANLKRHWQYRYLEDRDQHVFLLNEGCVGLKKHEKLIEEVYYRDGRWGIEDL